MAGPWWRLAQTQELPVEDVGVFRFSSSILHPRTIRIHYQPPTAALSDSWEAGLGDGWLEIPAGAMTNEGDLVVTSMIQAVDYREALAIYRINVRLDNGR